MPSLMNIGKSGLMAANVGLSVTGHNITNATIPGYNRQVIVQTNLPGQKYGFGFVGSGTDVSDVRRVFNNLLGSQALSAQSSKSQLDTYYTQITKINNRLADNTAGVSPALQDFFNSVQELTNTPNSAAVRQTLLSQTDILAGRFQSMGQQLVDIRSDLYSQIEDTVSLINTLASEIANLNATISSVHIGTNDPQPNDLLDQRDLLIAELSKQIGVSVVKQGNSYDIYIGNGQPLVINDVNFQMFAQNVSGDPNGIQVGYINNGNRIVLPDSALKGGAIGGLMDFRNGTLDNTENEIGRLAITLALEFNAQHRLGMDSNGDLGGDFFSVPLSVSGSNAAGGMVTATINPANVSQLQASNYRVQVVDATGPPPVYSITRLNDGQQFTANGPMNIDGLDFTFAGALADGDAFVLRPVAGGATGIQSLITDVNKIAAASPMIAQVSGTNAGAWAVTPGQVTSVASLPPAQTLTYSAGANEIQGFSGTVTVTVNGVSTSYTPPYTPPATGVPYTEGATYEIDGFEFKLTGIPEDGDTFSIGPNTNGVGDNRNMVLLAGLQTAKTMVGGSTDFQGAYSQLVNRVGNKTRELEITSDAAGFLLTELQNAIQSESGVNLDEEAARLLQYQQAYQAAARLIQSASDIFDILASLGR